MHIDWRYCFIADSVNSGEIRIEHCPTGIMIADYFTKPLQGALFWKLRDMVMGSTDIPLPSDVTTSVLPDPSIGIPDVSTLQESRSVLKDEIAAGGSPRSLSVLPAFAPKARKTVVPQVRKTGLVNKPVAMKKTISWADVVGG